MPPACHCYVATGGSAAQRSFMAVVAVLFDSVCIAMRRARLAVAVGSLILYPPVFAAHLH